jgi:hypothetical protein
VALSGGRALGIGLLAAGVVVALILGLWLAVSGATAGGIVLGLLLLVVIAGPLAGAGWFVLARQPAEERTQARFAERQRVVDADRAFRREIGVALRGLAEQHQRADLRRLADSVANRTTTLDALQLDDTQIDTLRGYDDLIWERVQALRAAPAGELDGRLAELQRSLDARDDLLLRGQASAGVPADELLGGGRAAGRPLGGATADVAGLALGWAISRATDDYVVEALATYFDNGATWRLAHLVPTSTAAAEAWLYVGIGASRLAWLALAPELSAASSPEAVEVRGQSLALVESRTAVVDVTSTAGAARGALVSVRRYESGPLVALLERWPEQRERAYAGEAIQPSEIDVWPATASSPPR